MIHSIVVVFFILVVQVQSTPDPCSLDPCQNGGTCNLNWPSYTCTCLEGWIGSDCEKVDPCLTGPCQNGGTCNSNGDGTLSCTCLSGWIGSDCSTIDPCVTFPCQNGGTCNTNLQTLSYSCDCLAGWKGSICDQVVLPVVSLAITTTEPTASSIVIEFIGSLGKSTHNLGSNFATTGIHSIADLSLSSNIGDLRSIKVTNNNPSDPWTFSTILVSGSFSMTFGENIKVKKSRILDGPLTLSFTVKSTSSSLSPIFFGFRGSTLSASRKIAGPFSKGQTVTRTFPFVNIHDIKNIAVKSFSNDDLDFDQIQVTFQGITKNFNNPTGQSVNKAHSLNFAWGTPI